MVHPIGRCRGRCVAVVPLDACITVLASVLPRVVDVRSGAVSRLLGLLYCLRCGVVCTISTPCLIHDT
jgi:hypothetical protein